MAKSRNIRGIFWGGSVLALMAVTAFLGSHAPQASAAAATAVSAGEDHTCAVTSAGGLKCWGINWSDELGDGTKTSRTTPVDVVGLTSGVVAVSAGRFHTCALTTAGGLKCWGRNYDGQLGNGTTTGRLTPVDVEGLTSGVASLSAGVRHTCAVTTAGGVKCWGENFYGQLGDGTTTERTTPVDVIGLTTSVASVSAGFGNTCALTTSGGVQCWGRNVFGQLVDGTTTDRNTPVDVVGLTSGVASVSVGGGHTCAVTTSGGVKCWGNNFYGQQGDGTTTDRNMPVDVIGLSSGVASVSASVGYTCAVTTSGGLKCWGDNTVGQLGDGTTNGRETPVDVIGRSSGVAAVSAGWSHACAVTTTGSVKCWGNSFDGQMGDGTTPERLTPTDVTGLSSGVASISAGRVHTCAVTAVGGLKCWGHNEGGQLGDDTSVDRNTPVDVIGLISGVASVSAGNGAHTCALTTAGGLKCWGSNGSGQLGDGTTTERTTPVDVVGVASAAFVSAGWGHTCALTTSGGVKCWGRNRHGELGDGTTTNQTMPGDVIGLTSGAAASSVGTAHTCAVTMAGGAKGWGYNGQGQLGNGTTTERSTPEDVIGLTSGVAAISAGTSHTCALTTLGGLKCWGRNSSGQLGDGTTISRDTPVNVVGLTSGVAEVSAGDAHSCALTTSGGVKCWGSNQKGQLGDGTTTHRPTPVDVIGLTSGAAAVSVGDGRHSCAMTTTGGVKCWGENTQGQLGDGAMPYRTTPVDVAGFTNALSITDATVNEGGNYAVLTITVDRSDQNVTVDLCTADGTAVAPDDYTSLQEGEGYFVLVVLSPIDNVGTFQGSPLTQAVPITLVAGLNMVGFPLITPAEGYDAASLAQAVQDQGGEVAQIVRWDPGRQVFVLWSAASPEANVFPIDEKAGYFVLVTQPTTAPFTP